MFRNNHICFNFFDFVDRNRTTFAATRQVLWGLNMRKMHLLPGLDRKCIFGVYSAKGTCLLAANVILHPSGN